MPIGEGSSRMVRSGRKRDAMHMLPTPPTNTPLISSPLTKYSKTPSRSAPEHALIEEEEEDKENVFMGVNYARKDMQCHDHSTTEQPARSITANDDNDSDVDSRWTETRQSFHRSHCIPKLVGRDEERRALRDAIQLGGRVYVCGSPGTGKTALVSEVIASLSGSSSDFTFSSVNCAMTTVNQFLGTPQSQTSKKTHKHRRSCVLVLDEVDHWRGEEVSLVGDSYHCIIGIANTLSLSNSLSTALNDGDLKVIRFMPYTVKEISDIIRERDKHALIDSMAMELISRRTASTSGDLRRALDVTVQCIDHLLACNKEATKVTLKDVLSLLSTLVEREEEVISTLSVHHRLIILLCPAASISALYEVYRKGTDGLIGALERGDFLDAVRLLASRNLLSLEKGGERRQGGSGSGGAVGGRRLSGSGNGNAFSPQGKEWLQRVSHAGKWTNEMLDKLKQSNAVLAVILDRTE